MYVNEADDEIDVGHIDIAITIGVGPGAERTRLRVTSEAMPDQSDVEGVDHSVAVHVGICRTEHAGIGPPGAGYAHEPHHEIQEADPESASKFHRVLFHLRLLAEQLL
jgi:hypothetical protein